MKRNETKKNQEKNKLQPARVFLFDFRVTATSVGKPLHSIAGPHFFLASARIRLPTDFGIFLNVILLYLVLLLGVSIGE